MLRGCILSLILLAALAGGYFYWLDQVFELPASAIAAGVVGFLVLCCLGAINNARTAWSDWSRVGAARFGMPLTGGKVIAVSGTLHPLAEPLIAPFSQTPCVLCEYDLASQKRVADAGDNESSGSDYAGFLMVPCAVRTALGEVRLLGFPILEGFRETTCGYASVPNAREFIESHEFEDRSGLKFISVLSVFGEIWSDDDGLVQKNMRLRKVALDALFPPGLDEDLERMARWEAEHPQPANEELEDDSEDDDADELEELEGELSAIAAIPKMTETRVAVGENVCAIGVYDEMRRGLVPPDRSGPPNRLIRGTADQIESRLRSAVWRRLAGGLIGLLVIHLAILGIMEIYRRSPVTIREQQQQAIRASIEGDLSKLASLVYRGLDVNFRDSEERTLLMMAQHAETSRWLIERGADVNAVDKDGDTALSFAARFGHTEIVRQLIAAKAKLDPRSRSTGQTPLAEAESRGDEATEKLLREAGAPE